MKYIDFYKLLTKCDSILHSTDYSLRQNANHNGSFTFGIERLCDHVTIKFSGLFFADCDDMYSFTHFEKNSACTKMPNFHSSNFDIDNYILAIFDSYASCVPN